MKYRKENEKQEKKQEIIETEKRKKKIHRQTKTTKKIE